MTSQSATGVASTYEWTADNRLKKTTVASGDFKLPPQEVHYKYDDKGRRLLKHVGTAGQRTRHFFNGLTEEIKKVSVGTHAETSFAFTTMIDGTSTTGCAPGWGTGASVASVYDADRFSDVLELERVTRYDFGWGSLRSEKTVSFWFKYGSGGTAFAFPVSTSLGNRRVHLIFTNGTSGYHSGTTEYRVYMGAAMNDGEWHRVEVDFSRIVATQTPGVTFNDTWGVWVTTRTSHRQASKASVSTRSSIPGSNSHAPALSWMSAPVTRRTSTRSSGSGQWPNWWGSRNTREAFIQRVCEALRWHM